MPDSISGPSAWNPAEQVFWRILRRFLLHSLANVIVFFCVVGCALLCDFAVRVSEYMRIDHAAGVILKGTATALLLGDVLVVCGLELWLIYRFFRELLRK